MTAIPEDILLEIMKYSPKSISLTCKFLRNKFNVYDQWIYDYKILKKQETGGFFGGIFYFFNLSDSINSEKPKIDPDLDFDKIRKLKVSDSKEILKKCTNLEKVSIGVGKLGSHYASISTLNRLCGLKKLIILYETDMIGFPWLGYMVKSLINANPNLEIKFISIVISDPAELDFIKQSRIKIQTLDICFLTITTEIIDIFMNDLNCSKLIINGSYDLYSVLSEYQNVKPGKKIYIIAEESNTWLFPILEDLVNDWIELILVD